jgi:enterochelin esterase-like enzyme
MKRIVLAACFILAAGASFAQSRVISPEVHADRKVTFRLLAPRAKEVSVRGSWSSKFDVRSPAAKSAEGEWTVLIGPLPPDRYTYHFLIDGVAVADPGNPSVKLGLRGPASVVDVPGPEADYHALRKGNHGTVHQHRYWSETAGAVRRMHVYTPPGYEAGKGQLPVLYLLHGSGDTDGSWFEAGRAAEILDNLLSANKSRPMLIVAPDGFILSSSDPESRLRNTALFAADLTKTIIPLVESTYRADKRRESRALAGLSMGGGQALNVGLPRLDTFAHIGVFSSGPLSQGGTVPQFLERHSSTLAAPAAINRQLKLFWVGCGTEDEAGVPNQKALIQILSERGIRHEAIWTEGGHTWSVWRRYLHQFLPLLFR